MIACVDEQQEEQDLLFNRLLEMAESPLEKKLLIHIRQKYQNFTSSDESKIWLNFWPGNHTEWGGENPLISVIPQWEVRTPYGNYRLDFSLRVLEGGGWFMFDVEIDGKKYHNTKERINADFERERALSSINYYILRFSGQDVYHNVDLVLEKIISAIIDAIKDGGLPDIDFEAKYGFQR